ncbi:MAG TPA: GNAT family N-acetyltransferase [Lachnospiraceae bacterium]|nr:GNAT family N-acetyltransferase [Lachnospiraceae bacterium]
MINPQSKLCDIRWASPADWQSTMQMVWKTFLKYEADDYTEEGIHNFYDFLTNGRIHKMFLEGTYLMMIALDDDRVIGQISVRNGNHISLLFVDEDYHNKGVGRELINKMGDYLKCNRNEVYVSVKAAPYAVGFYRRLGFRECSPEQEFSGIRVTSMQMFL